MIETRGLRKVFRDFWGHGRVVAIDDLCLEVRSHEVFGLLGPNGSGKSTTIKLLLGLLFATRGWSRVLGRPPGDVKTNARIGYLPEESNLYAYLNARETLDFYGRLFGLRVGERRRRIESLLDMVGLSSVARRAVGEYSKGMARRIGLAQALINDPDLLILDEPTAGLDPISTRQIKDLIRSFSERGKTVLLCSHLLADVEDVCDRIAILYGGRVRAEGKVSELLTRTELTEIRSGRLGDETVGKVKEVIRADHPDYEIEVREPRDRLESFFLRTVAEAEAAEVETSGAVMGSGLSEFLGGSEAEQAVGPGLIEELVGASPRDGASSSGGGGIADESQPAPLVEVGQGEAVRQEVLDSLTGGSAVSADREGASEESPTVKPVESVEVEQNGEGSASVDNSVIEQLIKASEEESEENEGEQSSDGLKH